MRNNILEEYNLQHEAEMRYYQRDTLSQYNMPQKLEFLYFRLNETLWQHQFPRLDSLSFNADLLEIVEYAQDYMIHTEMGVKDSLIVVKNPDVGGGTRYYNDKGELLFATNDGLSATIIVRDGDIPGLEKKLNEANANGTIHNPETNKNEMHCLGRTPEEYLDEATKGMTDIWSNCYKEFYEKAYYKEETSIWTDLVAIAGTAMSNNSKESTGAERHSAMMKGTDEGNIDRKNGRISRFNPYAGLKNNPPLIVLKSKPYRNEK